KKREKGAQGKVMEMNGRSAKRGSSNLRRLAGRATALAALFVGMVTLPAACGGGEGRAEADEGTIRITTTIAQIAEPLSVIGGDKVIVESLMGPGVDPHLYKATQGDIRKLREADVIFYNGLHLEANMLEAFERLGREKPVLAVAETIPEEKLLKDAFGAVDPHVWFDLDLWRGALAAAVELVTADAPAIADELEAGKQAYFGRLEALQEEAAVLASLPEERRGLVTAHDAVGYFGRAHGLEVVGVMGLSTEDEVGLTDIEATIDLLLERRVPAVFVESSVNPDAIRAVMEGAKARGLDVKLGGELFSDAMGDAGTEEGTYIGMYRHNVKTIYEALSGE